MKDRSCINLYKLSVLNIFEVENTQRFDSTMQCGQNLKLTCAKPCQCLGYIRKLTRKSACLLPFAILLLYLHGFLNEHLRVGGWMVEINVNLREPAGAWTEHGKPYIFIYILPPSNFLCFALVTMV